MARPPGRECFDACDRGRLVLLEIGHDAAGRLDAGEIGRQFEAEALQPLLPECAVHRSLRGGLFKPPVGADCHRASRRQHAAAHLADDCSDALAVLLRAEAFGRVEAEQQIGHVVAGHDRRLEATGGYVDPRDSAKDIVSGPRGLVAGCRHGVGRP